MKKILIISLVLNVVLICGFSAYAAISYDASQITYKTTTLDHAIDELYTTQNTTVTSQNTTINNYKTLRFNLLSDSESNIKLGRALLNFNDFSGKYAYFTANEVKSDSTLTSTCSLEGWGNNQQATITIGTRYSINYFSQLLLTSKSTTTSLGRCIANITFSN